MVVGFVFPMQEIVQMVGKTFIRSTNIRGRCGLRILFSIIEVVTMIYSVATDFGLSLCGISLALEWKNKMTILGGEIYGY